MPDFNVEAIRAEVRAQAAARREVLEGMGASPDITRGLVKLYELDGVFGIVGTPRVSAPVSCTKLAPSAHRLQD